MRTPGLPLALLVLLPLSLLLAPARHAGAQDEDAGADAAAEAGAPSEPEEEAEEAVLEEEPVEAIAQRVAPDVRAAVARTRESIQAARSATRPRRGMERIYRDLPGLADDVDRLARSRTRDQIARMSQRELADARHQWHEYEDQIEDWQTNVAERQVALEGLTADFEALERLWGQIASDPATPELPELMRERVPLSQEAVGYYGALVEGELERTRNLADHLAELALAIQDMTELIEQATRNYRDRLLVRDSPPIWESLARSDEETTLGEQARASWGDRAASGTSLLGRTQAPGAITLGAFFLVLTLLLGTLSRRSARWPADDEIFVRARRAVQKPFSTAALLVLSVAPFVVLNAPMLFYDLVMLLLLVPLFRVLPPLLHARARSLLVIVAVFLVAVRVESMTIEGTSLRRIVVTLECVPAVITLLVWLVSARRARGPGEVVPTWLIAVVGVALAVVIAALVADVTGWVFLSAMLMRGVVASAYGAFALFAGAVVIETLLAASLKSRMLGGLNAVRQHGPLVQRRIFTLLTMVAVLLWADASLEGFGMTRPVLDWLEEVFGQTWQVGSASFSLGAVVRFFLILALTWAVSRFVHFVLDVDVLPRVKLEPGLDGAISTLTRYVLVSIGILLGLASLGIDQSQIAIVAGALGVGVGFGLQGIVSNIVSGIILMLERPVRLGDFIEVGPLVGRVERIGLRSSTVRAGDGAEVIVPNDSLISREVVNWTLSDRRRRVRVKVGVAYGTDLAKARELLLSVASAHVQQENGPAPEVAFDTFGESSVDFNVDFWAEFSDAGRLKNTVGVAIYDALNEAGIEIPFPQRDVNVRSLPEPAPSALVATPPSVELSPVPQGATRSG